MMKLTDTQAILLATACQRDDGNLLPLHGSLKPGGGAARAIARLLRIGFAEERETTGHEKVHRTDGDTRFGVFVTDAGMAAKPGRSPGSQACGWCGNGPDRCMS